MQVSAQSLFLHFYSGKGNERTEMPFLAFFRPDHHHARGLQERKKNGTALFNGEVKEGMTVKEWRPHIECLIGKGKRLDAVYAERRLCRDCTLGISVVWGVELAVD